MDWYYVGHYGQLGPLTIEQMHELIQDGVIERDTFVWKTGLSDWQEAQTIPDFKDNFAQIPQSPPPIPITRPTPIVSGPPPAPGPKKLLSADIAIQIPAVHIPEVHVPAVNIPAVNVYSSHPYHQQHNLALPVSNKSRIAAGVLQILFPGIGRMYMGYVAQGILQLMLAFMCFGIGWIWSIIDGIAMLSGSVRYDGYGRTLQD